ncbi:hypothetical protein R69608_05137 [Paraburkholderia nemoris]|uniref:GH25 family lysozyme n=1 Tax=Paraburkholderia nemoris TaxID=2793076 RepID=UPI001911C322|nr:GH25 family lysozyme [Paraburkholderia nemoris]MBK5149659.1 hypothetical protein [Burkholderia sp. R-69608]CAE6939120.1 hypothetical protein R69608_05137 [Paraburkholderia nemoris]
MCIGCKWFYAILLMLSVADTSFVAAETDQDSSRQELFATVPYAPNRPTPFFAPQLFRFPSDARDDSVFGIDVSHYTEDNCKCMPNWDEIASQKVRFVYLKATESTTILDPSLVTVIPTLRKADKLNIGFFHFFSERADAEKQAQYFLSAIGQIQPQDLPPGLDLEMDLTSNLAGCPTTAVYAQRKNGHITKKCDMWGRLSSQQIIERANIWLDDVKKATGRDPIVYTLSSWWDVRIGAKTSLKSLHASLVWIADGDQTRVQNETPKVPGDGPWDLWQFTSTAHVASDGRVLKVDASVYHGNLSDMMKRLGIKDARQR